jgi:hypothetical protein
MPIAWHCIMMPRTLGAAAAVLTLALAGCERDYMYAPTVATTSAVSGRPASYYEVPPEAPRGYVQVTTLGFADIQRQGTSGSEERARAIRLRMVVANNSDKPWHIDTREQLLSLPNFGESRPALAISSAATAPAIEIPAGGKREIELFYPLPAFMDSAKELPAFDTIWKVQTDTRLVTDRTPFERLELESPYSYGYGYAYGYGYGYGWGMPYWYDPFYSRTAFYGVYAWPGGYGGAYVRPAPGR